MSDRSRRLCSATSAALLAGLALAAGVQARSEDEVSYSLVATKQCLKSRGMSVGPIRRSDARRIALSDLAQRTSFEMRMRRAAVLLAFAKTNPDAEFLAELLRVPRDPYVIRIRANVLLMYRPTAVRAATAATRCLRSG